jgi:hypothetical protein
MLSKVAHLDLGRHSIGAALRVVKPAVNTESGLCGDVQHSGANNAGEHIFSVWPGSSYFHVFARHRRPNGLTSVRVPDFERSVLRYVALSVSELLPESRFIDRYSLIGGSLLLKR